MQAERVRKVAGVVAAAAAGVAAGVVAGGATAFIVTPEGTANSPSVN